MPAIAVVLFGALFSLLALLLFYWHLLAAPPRRARGQYRRRRGYMPPPVSSGTNRGTLTRVPTRTVGAITKSRGPHGDPSGGLATRLTQPSPNRLTVPTAFGVVTVDHGANGQQRDSAA